MVCEGFLGIEPHFDLWRYLFAVSIQRLRVWGESQVSPISCASIHLHWERAHECMDLALMRTNKGWHLTWFYVKNYLGAPLLIFTSLPVAEIPHEWGHGSPKKEGEAYWSAGRHQAPQGPRANWHWGD